jgi:threonine dehydrogenase-like Zn-dependent dehydrogenase
VDSEEFRLPYERVKRVRDVVAGCGADLVMDCSGHPSAGPEGIEFLRDGGTYVEMGQFTDAASSVQTLYPFSEEGIALAVADAMATKTVKSTIVPWPDLVQ